MRKIKRRKKTFRITCDHLAYEDENGEEFFPRVGQWVEFRKKTSANDYAQMLSFAALENSDDLEAMAEAIPRMADLAARKIVAWNWTDLESEPDEEGNFPPLGEPTLEIIADLDFETDLSYLVEAIFETPKN